MSKLILISLLISITNFSTIAADADTCQFGVNSCLTATSRWINNGRTFQVTFKNECSRRLLVRFCKERKYGQPDCGDTGIRAYKTYTTSTGNNTATGRYRTRYIGVEKPSKDWVCASKVQGWHDPMF